MTVRADRGLLKLGRLYGIEPAYFDVRGRQQDAKAEALMRALRALGVPIEKPDDAEQLAAKRRLELWRRVIEPVIVAWEGQALTVVVRMPQEKADGVLRWRIECEGAEAMQGECSLRELPATRRRRVQDQEFIVKRLVLSVQLPHGYHDLTIEAGGESHAARLIAAPMHVSPGPPADDPRWGVFAPLYAFHRETSWSAGDFSDLRALMDWTADLGGNLVATLPMLATLWELSDDPSPYSPTSRLFWNEFYLDVTQAPGFSDCREAQDLLHSPSAQEALDAMRRDRLVDYTGQMKLKRRVLMALSKFFFDQPPERRAALDRFRAERPEIERFAQFRAVGERQGKDWHNWPQRLRDGRIEAGDFDEHVYQFHLYTQWSVERQLQDLLDHAEARDLLWYLDLPLGTSGGGFDVWSRPDLFAIDASGGAPPDPFFPGGQNWGFPPLHPQRNREDGHRYLIACLRHHLRFAKVLRIDHVMSLHRLYWVPHGVDAADGVYVRYPTQELFAILTLESHRHEAVILGEDLGTVPERVDETMRRHHVPGMYVVPFEIDTDRPEHPLRSIPQATAASLNTHDLPQFHAFWTGLDIDDRAELGLLTDEQVAEERESRAALRHVVVEYLRREGRIPEDAFDPIVVLEALLGILGSSRAALVLVNLEDLWEETQPQNTPGTYKERPNWRRKMRYRFEQFAELPTVQRILRRMDEQRRQAGKHQG